MTTINYFDMFHDATREHAEALMDGPIGQSVQIYEARHVRAPMYDGDPNSCERVECACGDTLERSRGYLVGDDWSVNEPDEPWRIERCDGSACGIENCGRMLAKCGRCRCQ